jgi:hypothetical protein
MALWQMHMIAMPERSRLQAFEAQDVPLRYSWQSWSGVRRADGMVVFAIAEADVEADDSGCRCLLWSRDAIRRFGARAGEERLAHCRLALCHGNAEALVVGADALVASSSTLELRVERIAEQYWALWGSATQARRLDGAAPPARLSRAAA